MEANHSGALCIFDDARFAEHINLWIFGQSEVTELDINWVVGYLSLGAVTGFLAGLLGISGGGIMVPVLTSMFLAHGMAQESAVHLALGTSMASMITSSYSSFRAHRAEKAISWCAVRGMTPGIILGALLATFIASRLSAEFLAIFFAVFMVLLSSQMLVAYKPQRSEELASKPKFFYVGSAIGSVSALVTVGSGFLTVAYLTWQNVNVKKAIGTSATIALPLAVAGSLGYMINGWSNTSLNNYIVGFVYLPAALTISIGSYFFAPIGARLAHSLPVAILRKIFAIMIVLLAGKMLMTVLL